MGAVLLRGTAFALVWWVLAEGRADSWGVGVVSVAAALAASLYLAPPGAGRLSPTGLLGFAGFFLAQSFKGGVQVAVRAFRPAMDLAPALVDVPVALPDGLPRVLLVNTLNLLPGTVSVRLAGDRLRLHVLDARLPIAEEVRQAEARIACLWRTGP
ncbi:MAG TPA: Na+/H+ antiporter subunit E [Thiobacillaceae bacterium]|nr:Na+/H+ antiporter subunit E [Thiobacillaceae bacterium]